MRTVVCETAVEAYEAFLDGRKETGLEPVVRMHERCDGEVVYRVEVADVMDGRRMLADAE